MSRQLEFFPSSWLPPQDFLLVNNRDKIPTPVNDLGLVDIPQLFADVKATVDPEFVWPIDVIDAHHFYWPRTFYPHEEGSDILVNPSVFRNMSVNRGLIPRVFHNWMHIITLPPLIPDTEVMVYRTEAWTVARKLFHSIKNAKAFERKTKLHRQYMESGEWVDSVNGERDALDEDAMAEILEKFFNDAEDFREKMLKVPKEFRIVDPELSIQEITTVAGKLVANSSMNLVRAAAA